MVSYISDVIIILFLFALFGYLHSLLASNRIKKFTAQILGDKVAFYRLTYNLISLLLFFFIYDLMPKPYLIIYDLPNPFDLVVLIPQFIALAGIIWSIRYFSLTEFIGINQVIRWKKGIYDINELDEKMSLKIEGPYKYTRHPVYFFIIVYLLFRPAMDLFYLVFFVCIIVYFYIGSVYEEKKLIEVFGEQYRQYKKMVPGIIPFKFSKPNRQ